MALETNELFKSNSQSQEKRIIPRRALVKTLAAQTGAVTEGNGKYLPGVVLAYNESTLQWDLWNPAGLNGLDVVRGILYVEKDVSETDEVHVVVMTEGEVHFDDLLLLDNSGSGGTDQGASAGLEAALQNPATRSALLVVKGLAGVG